MGEARQWGAGPASGWRLLAIFFQAIWMGMVLQLGSEWLVGEGVSLEAILGFQVASLGASVLVALGVWLLARRRCPRDFAVVVGLFVPTTVWAVLVLGNGAGWGTRGTVGAVAAVIVVFACFEDWRRGGV
jgi:hypothetical protein